MANGWTLERRRKQSLKIREWKPWEKSTGPRTYEGKARAALNRSTLDPDSDLFQRRVKSLARRLRARDAWRARAAANPVWVRKNNAACNP